MTSESLSDLRKAHHILFSQRWSRAQQFAPLPPLHLPYRSDERDLRQRLEVSWRRSSRTMRRSATLTPFVLWSPTLDAGTEQARSMIATETSTGLEWMEARGQGGRGEVLSPKRRCERDRQSRHDCLRIWRLPTRSSMDTRVGRSVSDGRIIRCDSHLCIASPIVSRGGRTEGCRFRRTVACNSGTAASTDEDTNRLRRWHHLVCAAGPIPTRRQPQLARRLISTPNMAALSLEHTIVARLHLRFQLTGFLAAVVTLSATATNAPRNIAH